MKMKGFESKHMLIIAISEQLFKSIGHAVPEVHQSGMGQSLFTCKYMNLGRKDNVSNTVYTW
jgi:hypothetical protein